MSILDNYYGEGMSIREKIEDLERKVKSQLSLLTTTRNTLSKFVEENKKLKEEKEIRALNDRDNLIQIEKLEQENKKLKEKIKELEERLDNKEKVNKQLREELGKFIMKS